MKTRFLSLLVLACFLVLPPFAGPSMARSGDVHCPGVDGPLLPGAVYESPSQTRELEFADVDEDGRLDAVSVGWYGIGFMKGNGDGSFQSPVVTSTDIRPEAFELVDIDGDGDLDVVAVCRQDELLSVHLGTGDGNFLAPIEHHVADLPFALELADLDSDGSLDVLVRVQNNRYVEVLLGAGDGTFGPALTFPTGISPPLPLLQESVFTGLSDLDSDGVPDLVLGLSGTPTGTVAVFTGDGDGRFTYSSSLAAQPFAEESRLDDIDGDGEDELTLVVPSGVVVHENSGAPGFGSGTAHQVFENAEAMAFGDLNSDGKTDIVALEPDDHSYSVSIAITGGNFGPARSFPMNEWGGALDVRDLNGDGSPDLVALTDTDLFQVNLWQEEGGIGSPVMGDTPGWPSCMNPGDFDGDGRLDLAVGTFEGVTIALQVAERQFDSLPTISFSDRMYAMQVGELNGDGILDLVTLNEDDDTCTVTVFFGVGDGTFSVHQSHVFPSSARAMFLRDWDQDGIDDLVLGGLSGGPEDLLILDGQGGGDFAGPVSLVPGGWQLLDVVDVDGDGILDLVEGAGTDELVVRRGVGNGAVGPRQDSYAGLYASLGELRDLNADGALDAVLTSYPVDEVAVLLGAGDGSFGAPTMYEAGDESQALALGDLNGDGFEDIVVGDSPDALIAVLPNAGDGTFGTASHFFCGRGIKSALVLDVDADGINDAALNVDVPNAYSILFGRQFGPTTHGISAPNSHSAGAQIGWSGSRSVSANDLVLEVTGCPPGQFGLFFYGPERASTPFGPNGYLNVGPGATGLFRLPLAQLTDGAGAVVRPLDFDASPMDAGAGAVVPGSTWSFQFWYRDPSLGFNLSDALEVTFCP